MAGALNILRVIQFFFHFIFSIFLSLLFSPTFLHSICIYNRFCLIRFFSLSLTFVLSKSRTISYFYLSLTLLFSFYPYPKNTSRYIIWISNYRSGRDNFGSLPLFSFYRPYFRRQFHDFNLRLPCIDIVTRSFDFF